MAQIENVFDTEAAAQTAVDADFVCFQEHCKCSCCDPEDPEYDAEFDGNCSCAQHLANLERFDFVRQDNDGKWCYMSYDLGSKPETQREYDHKKYDVSLLEPDMNIMRI